MSNKLEEIPEAKTMAVKQSTETNNTNLIRVIAKDSHKVRELKLYQMLNQIIIKTLHVNAKCHSLTFFTIYMYQYYVTCTNYYTSN